MNLHFFDGDVEIELPPEEDVCGEYMYAQSILWASDARIGILI